jgi:EAL domain-containing protein (putative c-di-GMP-specific phosphodiesterase class I)/GGDEF domain-containing protein
LTNFISASLTILSNHCHSFSIRPNIQESCADSKVGARQRKATLNADLDYKNLLENERVEVDNYLNESLVDHLYKTAPSGVTAGAIASTIIFIFFYEYTPLAPLLSWYIGFNSIQILILALYISYRKFKTKSEMKTWGLVLSSLLAVLTLFYGASVLFTPKDETHQILLLAILFMLASSFSMVSVGLFKLCVASVSFILVPVIAWVFLHDNLYYKMAGGLIIVYSFFLMAMNKRSTEWLKNSLKLSRILVTVSHTAYHDIFTDLPNQRGLLSILDNAIKTSQKNNQFFGVFSFTINKIDLLNNTFGYQAGDLIRQSLAKRLTAFSDEGNQLYHDKIEYKITLPRPDSFVILIIPFKIEFLKREVDRLFSVLENPFSIGNKISRLTASIGVSVYPNDGEDSRSLLGNSYAAMFQAKQRGGNQVVIYKKSINEKTPYLLDLENDLHLALEKKQFVIYYQPIIDLQNNNQISGMEALIRWQHPVWGLIPPLDFIPLAEENGLIMDIGDWVLEEAAKQVLTWHQNGYKSLSLKVAVNLSPKQLREGDILGSIDRVIAKTGLDPKLLELELTETAVLDEAVAPIITAIANKGVTLSIDDFGTGYSGLSYLRFFHIDKIKIDKSFIDDVVTNSESATIVSAILAMAKELGIKTLAEGIEKKEQLEFLQEKGCQYIQGYYFSKPLPAKEFQELLDKSIADNVES